MIRLLRQVHSGNRPASAPRPSHRLGSLAAATLLSPLTVLSQNFKIIPNTEEDLTWWYVTLGVLVVALILVARRLKAARQNRADSARSRGREPVRGRVLPSMGSGASPNRAREVEWLKSNRTESEKLSHLRRDSEDDERAWINSLSNEPRPDPQELEDEEPVPAVFSDLPVSKFRRVETPEPIELLPTSDDPGLLNAIEQTREGFTELQAAQA